MLKFDFEEKKNKASGKRGLQKLKMTPEGNTAIRNVGSANTSSAPEKKSDCRKSLFAQNRPSFELCYIKYAFQVFLCTIIDILLYFAWK